MKRRIYIGWDSSQEIAYDVLEYSILKHSKVLKSNIYPIKLHQMRSWIGFERPHDPLQSTEFTYTRFLVPHLMGYEGLAIFMDSDMLALGDVAELFELPMKGFALRVVKHDYRPEIGRKMGILDRHQSPYPRKNWSSLMLMNCSELKCWTKEVVEEQTGAWLHRFQGIPDEKIGEIDGETWNVLDRYDEKTKLIHYTEGGPWLAGCEKHPYGDVWFRYLDEMVKSL